MKALEIVDAGVLRVAERPHPTPGPRQVVVRSEVVGICHSDIELLHGFFITPFTYPIVPGHEWVGVVDEVGEQVTELSPGDRVVGDCRVAANDYFGLNLDGAAAEYFLADADWLYTIPASLTPASGAFIEPFTVAYYGIHVHGGVAPGENVVILGAGAIGLCCVAAVVGMGGTAIVVDPDERRRALARSIGAVHAFTPGEALLGQVREVTGGTGGDLVLECSGASAALADALQLVRQFGRITYIGFNIGHMVTSELGLIQSKDLSVKGITGSPDVWPEAIGFMVDKGIDLTPLVTASFPLVEAPEAFARVEQGRDIKVHIVVAEGLDPRATPT